MTRTDAGGFTLLEVLIAFVILSLTLATVFSAFSTGLRSLGSAEEAELAVLRAQSKLETVGQLEPLAASLSNGEFEDGATWEVVIEPFFLEMPTQGQDAAPEDTSSAQLFDVGVTVTAASGRRVELRSLRWSSNQ
jgi:general secretion pathway protein I